MNNPTISIIMGAYNAEKHIENAILSILGQTFRDFEFIIVNDGSQDNTLNLIKQFSDPRIVLIEQENQGLTKSLNNALALAKGKYIARQDADDISIDTRLEEQLEKFETDNELVLLGSSMYISNGNGVFNEVFHYPSKYEELKEAIYSYNPFVHGATMIKRQVLINEGGYNEEFRYVQDYELWSRIVTKHKCENIAKPLYARLREGDCSENKIDKSEYVEKIQLSLKGKRKQPVQSKIIEIEAQSMYPYIGWPFKLAQPLSKTYRGMAKTSAKLDLEEKALLKMSRIYFPWWR